MEDVIKAAVQAVEQGHSRALITPVLTQGSVPTGRGARLLVAVDGSTVGTVGGGAVEAEATRRAMETVRSGKPCLLRCQLTAWDALGDGLLCGGEATFFIEPLTEDMLEPLRVITASVSANRPCVEAIRLIEGLPVQRLVIDAEGNATGTLGAAVLDQAMVAQRDGILTEDEAAIRQMQLQDMEVEVFVQAVQRRPTVYIFGGGHVGLALAQLVPVAGMDVVVVDDREEFCNRDRFPMAAALHVRSFDGAVDGLDLDPLAYVVVMTRGHQWDREVVAQALRTRAGYIGMIGSRRKIALIWQVLRDAGFDDADLARVHAPIGLDIGGDSPGEIAISIVAQLIQVRRMG